MGRAIFAHQFDRPLGEMNTTPLIDVLLVLLVMLILAVPAAVNQVPVDLPARAANPDQPRVERDRNAIRISAASVITWNGNAVSQAELAALLGQTLRFKPEPELRFEPDPQAPYDTAARVLNQVKSSGVTAFGFVGNDRYANFGKPGATR